jgi:hypothetical protein
MKSIFKYTVPLVSLLKGQINDFFVFAFVKFFLSTLRCYFITRSRLYALPHGEKLFCYAQFSSVLFKLTIVQRTAIQCYNYTIIVLAHI